MGFKNFVSNIVNNPKTLTIGGIGLFVAAGVWACVQTVTAEDIVDEANDIIDDIRENHSEAELELPEVKKEISLTRAKMIGKLAWHYAGPVVLAGMAGYALCRAYGIQRKAYVAMTAAYGALSKAYDSVIDRVAKKWGEEGVKYAKYGIETVEKEIETVDEKGKKHKETVKEEVVEKTPSTWAEMKKANPHMIIFDDETPIFTTNNGDIKRIMAEINVAQNALQIDYNCGNPVYYNDIVRLFFGNDPKWLTDFGQMVGCYKGDPENREAIGDTIDLRPGIFNGHDPETGLDVKYAYIDPVVSIIDLDKNRKIWPQAVLQMDRTKRRVGGRYISQVEEA